MPNDAAAEKPLDLETRLKLAEASWFRWAAQAGGWHRRYRSVSAALFTAAALAAVEFVVLVVLALRAAGVG